MPRPLVSNIPRLDEILALFPTRTNDELAEQFGLNRRQLTNIGSTYGLTKTPEAVSRARRVRKTPMGTAPWTTQLLQAIAAAGAAGMSFAQAARAASTANADQARATLNKLTAAGKLFRYAKHRSSRWFATKEWAEAYGALSLMPAPSSESNGVQIRAAPAPATRPGDPRITADTRITTCPGVPGPEARWHGNARPIFSGLGPGVYTDQPSSWVKAVTSKP